MAKIHFVLQGKGGVGKSMSAAILAQYIGERGGEPSTNIDTDPVNATFQGYKALNVKRLQIMEADEINPRRFDTLIEMIAAAKENHIKLMIAYRLHLDAANMEAVEVVKSGQIGEPRFFNSIFAQQTEQNNSRRKAVTIVGSATVVTCRSPIWAIYR